MIVSSVGVARSNANFAETKLNNTFVEQRKSENVEKTGGVIKIYRDAIEICLGIS